VVAIVAQERKSALALSLPIGQGYAYGSAMANVALFLHLLGALLFVAAIVVAGVAFESARRRERPDEIALLLGLARAAVPLVVFGALLVFGCGLWLVGLADRVDYGTGWVDAAIALFVIALGLGGWGGQAPRRAREHATLLAAAGEPSDRRLRELLNDRPAALANYASAALVVAILALMVFKP
jgi:hypothetical protein